LKWKWIQINIIYEILEKIRKKKKIKLKFEVDDYIKREKSKNYYYIVTDIAFDYVYDSFKYTIFDIQENFDMLYTQSYIEAYFEKTTDEEIKNYFIEKKANKYNLWNT